MEQSGPGESKQYEIPQEPITVLGKRDDFIFVGRTVEETLENLRRYLPIHGGGYFDNTENPNRNRLTLEDMEFFDVAGRRLEPVMEAGLLAGFTIKNYRDEVRDRLQRMSDIVERDIQDNKREAGHDDAALKPVDSPVLPEPSASFDDFIMWFILKYEDIMVIRFGGCSDTMEHLGLCSC